MGCFTLQARIIPDRAKPIINLDQPVSP